MRRAFTLQMASNPNLDPAWSTKLPGCPRCGHSMDLMNFGWVTEEGTHLRVLQLTALCSAISRFADGEGAYPCGTEARLVTDNPRSEVPATMVSWETGLL